MSVVTPGQAVPDPVEESVLDDLRRRLRTTRAVPLPPGLGWQRGTDADYLRELLGYWADGYDWRRHEKRLRALPWRYDAGLRSIHAGSDPTALPVVLLHGWPDSFFRFDRVLPLLSDLSVVVPCLPGYPYADPETRADVSATTMADQVVAALEAMGYERFVVSGGDIGSQVAEQLGARHADRVAALHLTDIPWRHLFDLPAEDLTDAERDYAQRGQAWQFSEGAYALEQGTKPHTLTIGLGDSPAGLAAWIVEKLRSWSDIESGDLESVYPRDDLLTWITLYWVTGTIGSSFLPYVNAPAPVTARVEVPTVTTIFPGDLLPAPRVFGERFFDIRDWREQPDGGHFGAWERPEAFAAGLRRTLELASS